MLDRYAVRHKI